MHNRSAYMDFIENRYFGSVASGDLNAVLDCFADDAEVVIRHGDLPERHFSPSPGPGQEDLRLFFSTFAATTIAGLEISSTPSTNKSSAPRADLRFV